MASVRYWMYVPTVVALLSALLLGVWLLLLACRHRSTALWWLFVLMGFWPIVSLVGGRALTAILAMSRGGPGSNSTIFMWHGLMYGGSLVVTFILSCVVVLKVVALCRTERTHAQPLCLTCGYNLTGLEQNRCPECGTAFSCEVRYIVRTA